MRHIQPSRFLTIRSAKYVATIAVKSLRETEGEEERERMLRKNRMTIIALR